MLTRLIGGAQPFAFSALFTNPDGTPCERPCLFGVRPGYTRHEDAIAILRSHPLTRHLQQTSDVAGEERFVGENITISMSSDVSWISFQDYRPTLHRMPVPVLPRGTLADVILVFGPPDAVVLGNRLYCSHPGYRLFTQYQRPTDNHIDPQIPLLELFIGAGALDIASPARRPWQGFSLAGRYLFTVPEN